MNLLKKENTVFFSVLCVIYILAWVMQSHVFLNDDVSWQMHLSRVVLRGGNYMKNFFEVNPPLSIFLYMPAIFLGKFLLVSHVIALRVYIYVCASGSLLLCYQLMRRLFSDKTYRLYLISILASIYLILPMGQFGQREHLLVMLVMPYLLLVVSRLQRKKIQYSFALFLGILAALGFCLKPYFFTTFILLEGYVFFSAYHTANKGEKFRCIFSVIRPETIMIAMMTVLYLVFIFIFFRVYISTVVPVALDFYYPFFKESWQKVVLLGPVFFCLFALLLYFFQFKKNTYPVFNTAIALSLIGFLLSYLWQRMPMYYHLYPAFSFALLLVCHIYFCYVQRAHSNGADALVVFAVAMAVFFYPIYFSSAYYQRCVVEMRALRPLVHFFQRHKLQRPVYFFSAFGAYMNSVFEAAHVPISSEQEFTTWMHGYPAMKDGAFFVNLSAENILRHKPALVLVDTFAYQIDPHHIEKIPYLKVFLKNKQFKAAWRPYHYVTTLQEKQAYQFSIYERKL